MSIMKHHISNTNIKTRFLIISDTHGAEFTSKTKPQQYADVAIHCGDLTDGSKLEEFQTTIRLLKEINAPLKLVIAGNHDFTMDIPIFKKKVAEVRPPLDPKLVIKEYGDYGDVRKLFDEARAAGVVLLDEGTHRFTLENGASLTVYASPFTPSLGDWGFQYHPEQGHDFVITEEVNVVMSHGPPKGIMDYTESRQRAGCPDLFRAVARARPQLHCFGHIHEGWAAKLVTWRDEISKRPSYFTDIDNEKSILVDKLSGLRESKFDTPETLTAKRQKLENCNRERCYATSHCSGDPNPIEQNAQTLFVNAAIQSNEEDSFQLPWLVDIGLPKVEYLATTTP